MRRSVLLLPLLIALAACTNPGASKLALSDKDHPFGNTASPVNFVTYGDYQCPACAYYETMVDQLQQRYQDRVLFGFRHFPLETIHPNALLAAEAAESAAAQGKFWEMHRKLYATQKEWSELADPTENFVGYATTIGLDAAKFRTDLTGHAYREIVKASGAQAMAIGVNATPTFFLNGKQLESQPQNYTGFQAIIDKALAEAAQAATTSSTPPVSPTPIQPTVSAAPPSVSEPSAPPTAATSLE